MPIVVGVDGIVGFVDPMVVGKAGTVVVIRNVEVVTGCNIMPGRGVLLMTGSYLITVLLFASRYVMTG